MAVSVSPLTSEERSEWERLFSGYADFYQVPIDDTIVDAVWSWIFDESIPFYCLIARNDEGRPVGFAHVKATPSPLRGKMVGYLDDLYVDPRHRGEGIADALMAALSEEAEKRGWPFIRWITRDQNYRARALYDKYATRTDWVTYQLDGTGGS